MKTNSIYLDFNATTPLWPNVQDTLHRAMGYFGNPSSIHAWGRQAQGMIEGAREKIAQAVNVHPSQVIFTSSGTEANNLVLQTYPDEAIISSTVEHVSVLHCSEKATRMPVDQNGLVRPEQVEKLLRHQKASLLSLMLANNETGVIQPLSEIAKIAHAHGCRLHTDAVQAFGKIPVDFQELDVDYLSLSAHKIGGPKGIGALIIRDDAPLTSFMKGGGQERRRRAGTENFLGILGFAAAVEEISRFDWHKVLDMRVLLEKQLKELGITIVAENTTRLPNTISAIYPSLSSEMLVMQYDLSGIAISAGSACSSGKVQKSHVLSAMGQDTDSAIRISLGWTTTEQDIETFVSVTKQLLNNPVQEAA